MKILVVTSYTSGKISPFVYEQVKSLNEVDIETSYSLIRMKGIVGYCLHLPKLINDINKLKPDIVHAHYGLCGLLSTFQYKVPVITSFHGSDINIQKNLLYSKIAMQKSSWSVFVSGDLTKRISAKKNYSIIPCGTDLNNFYPENKSLAREMLTLSKFNTMILFSGSFSNKIKNYPLANEAVKLVRKYLNDKNIEIVELKGYSRNQVNLLLNSCDVTLLTSYNEGSPNIIKEALACNRPIVSTDVGDVKMLIENVPGCYIAKTKPEDIADKIIQALQFEDASSGRQRIIDLGLDLDTVAGKIVQIYQKVLSEKRSS